jgi:CxxC-x17-CxxC domain-containing protein
MPFGLFLVVAIPMWYNSHRCYMVWLPRVSDRLQERPLRSLTPLHRQFDILRFWSTQAMSYADKTLTCRDCGTAFTFTAGEQAFYAEKGFANEPTRCADCRQTRKQNRNSGDSYGSSSGGYGGGDSYGGGARQQREMFTATCSQCGRDAQVPFVPRGDKPVYCSDCFQSQRPARSNPRW